MNFYLFLMDTSDIKTKSESEYIDNMNKVEFKKTYVQFNNKNNETTPLPTTAGTACKIWNILMAKK
jgi:hypothetical protein